METSLKTGFAQIFSCCPKKSELPKLWGGCSPPRPPGPYAYGSKFSNLSNWKAEAIRASTGFEPVTSALPVRCSTS